VVVIANPVLPVGEGIVAIKVETEAKVVPKILGPTDTARLTDVAVAVKAGTGEKMEVRD